jgi:hypothetical protein
MSVTNTIPEYKLRFSTKAKRVVLKISPAKGFEVVVPQGFDIKRLPGILAAKESWIHQTMARLRTFNPVEPEEAPLPQAVDLEAVNLSCRIIYRLENGPRLTLDQRDPTQLVVAGDTNRREPVRTLLRQWLIVQGRRLLLPWLEEVSRETGLAYTRAQVRRQATRWGSCSRLGHVSLNCKLLFLPAPLVRYVLIHELCHTRHLNHSHRFWREVSRREPGYQDLDRDLSQAWRLVPTWAN